MARKAVQGYTEKSYFDNTRFLGLLATSDPLQEGYFRHLVNLDISDTGQSVSPRSGYLTTTLCNNTPNKTLISLSDKTLIYKDERIQEHIIYDFEIHKGYTADLSIYNIQDKLIPYIRDIGHYEWDDVIEYIKDKSQTTGALYEEILEQHYASNFIFTESDITYYNDSSTKYTLDIPFTPTSQDGNLSTLFIAKYGSRNIVRNAGLRVTKQMQPPPHPATYDYYKVEFVSDTVVQDATEELEETIKRNLKIINDNLVSTYDLAGINKRMFHVSYDDEFNFWIQMYYRKDSTTILDVNYLGNTIIFNALNLEQHPTYDLTNRNIANPNPIIPETFQTLYTQATRPTGHVSFVTPYLFVSNVTAPFSYYISHVYRNEPYLFRPHFELSPAHYVLSEEQEDSCAWAYKFEIVSTKAYRTDDPLEYARVFKSPWYKYTGPSTKPERLFTTWEEFFESSGEQLLLTASNPLENHYNKTKTIIVVVPKTTTVAPQYSERSIGGVYTKPETIDDAALEDAVSLYLQWRDICSFSITGTSYEKIIRDLGETALFYVYNLTAPDYTGGLDTEHFNTETGVISDINVKLTAGGTGYTTNLWTAEQVLTYGFNASVFVNKGVTFKFMPVSFFDTCVTTFGGGTESIEQYTFTGLKTWSLELLETHNTFVSFFDNVNYPTLFDPDSYSEYPLFYKDNDGTYEIGIDLSTWRTYAPRLYNMLETEGFFTAGYTIMFKFFPYRLADIEDKTKEEELILYRSWDASAPVSFSAAAAVQYGYDATEVSKIQLIQNYDPEKIANATGYLVYDDDRLVVWNNADLYISEHGDMFYFKEVSHKKFAEKIVKVIQYKTVLLVFTVQHLYAVYEMEVELPGNTQDADGNTIPRVETTWMMQQVLYNILTSSRYADAIQIFNQMVLFYSEDGQLFLIKPSTQIDDQTRFSLQYFNKSANNILQNFEIYMNERLIQYGIEKVLTKDDVNIKVTVSVNFIKIFYDAPGYMTYILHYDVLNNRYFVYDTLSFHGIKQIYYTSGGSFLLTHYNNKSYFTLAYNEPLISDSQSDMAVYNNFQKLPIATLLDTGDMNLNNHLMKRFRDLYITFKNLGSRELMFRIETEIDDVVHVPLYATQLEVKDINGSPYFVTVMSPTEIDLLSFIDDVHSASDEVAAFSHVMRENVLSDQAFVLDVANYTSNKLITYRTSILGVGKVFRLKLQFISKGSYKIQQFGIIYKERRV